MPRRKRNRKSGQNNGVQNGVPATESHDPVISQAIAMGLQSQQAGNLHQAELIYKKVLTADPSNAEAYRLLGALSYEKGEPAAAILLIQKAIATLPTPKGHSARRTRQLPIVEKPFPSGRISRKHSTTWASTCRATATSQEQCFITKKPLPWTAKMPSTAAI